MQINDKLQSLSVSERTHVIMNNGLGALTNNEIIDDGWGDAATAVTGNTSDRSNSPIGNGGTVNSIKWATIPQENQSSDNLGWCQRYVGSVIGAGVVVIAVASPIVMVVGHRIGFPSSRPVTNTRECGPECHAFLLALAVKLVALFGAVWAIFWRGSPATMPRIFFFRAITLLLAFLAAFTFWLFYWVILIPPPSIKFY
ncbi:Vang-like protein 1 [Orchesella cincta]|uniref:Vang-like protein 1 n=1 Tax=Orchesella cincta TaxID=48709 RepID=A0A1D2N7T2_ORCCI|nr:Vang-like protein 1 [Orchesella cincta]